MKKWLWAVAGLLAPLLGCSPAPGVQPLVRGEGTCEPHPPIAAEALREEAVESLAGSYRFVLVSDTPGLRNDPDSGLLRLWSADSVHRSTRRLPWALGFQPLNRGRQLTGVARLDDWTDPKFEGLDPDWPGAQVRGDTLLLGRELVNDYSPYEVQITRVAAGHIWGRWRMDLNLVVLTDSTGHPHHERRGHFCAWRVAPDSTATLVPPGT